MTRFDPKSFAAQARPIDLAARRGRRGRALGGSLPGSPDPVRWGACTAPVTASTPLGPEGVAVASGASGTVVAGRPDDGTASTTIGRHGACVTAMASMNGTVVTGGVDRRVVAWQQDGERWLPSLLGSHAAGVTSAAVLADSRVVTSGHDGRLLVWNTQGDSRRPLQLAGHRGGVNALAASASGLVAGAAHDGGVFVWSLVSRAPAQAVRLTGLSSWTLAMTFVDHQFLVTTNGPDGEVCWWDLTVAHPVGVRLGRHGQWVAGVVKMSSSTWITVGGREIRLWDAAGSHLPLAELPDGAGWTTACVLADGSVAACTTDGAVYRIPVPAVVGRPALERRALASVRR